MAWCPRDLIYSCRHFRREMRGLPVPRGIYVSICGSDLVRLPDGSFAVLEDNLRVPSGVSYMLANRKVLKRVFPSLFSDYGVRPDRPLFAVAALTLCARSSRLTTPAATSRPSSCSRRGFLTPPTSSTLSSRSKWASSSSKGRDLLVHDNIVYMRTTAGLRRVDVIYRRVDDDFIDPLGFRTDSRLGVPGLFNAYRAGNVTMANAPGTGVADDKAIYAYVPAIIRYYLGQDPILENIETFVLTDKTQRESRARASGKDGGQGGRRIRRLRDVDRPAQHRRGAREIPPPD